MKKFVVVLIVGATLVLWFVFSLLNWATIEFFGTGLKNGSTAIVTRDISIPSWDAQTPECTIQKGTTVKIGSITTVEQGSSDLRVRYIDSVDCSGFPGDDLGLKRSLDVITTP